MEKYLSGDGQSSLSIVQAAVQPDHGGSLPVPAGGEEVQVGGLKGLYSEDGSTRTLELGRESTHIWLRGSGTITKELLIQVATSMHRVTETTASPTPPVSTPRK
jgi:hypothetical protein